MIIAVLVLIAMFLLITLPVVAAVSAWVLIKQMFRKVNP